MYFHILEHEESNGFIFETLRPTGLPYFWYSVARFEVFCLISLQIELDTYFFLAKTHISEEEELNVNTSESS